MFTVHRDRFCEQTRLPYGTFDVVHTYFTVSFSMNIGPRALSGSTFEFVVWAPLATPVELELFAPSAQLFAMTALPNGYWRIEIEGIFDETRYRFRLSHAISRPDPASRFQPEGVQEPSAVVDHRRFAWQDQMWRGLDLSQLRIYELHVGTFTPEGTFAAIIPRLPQLVELGITAVELMPAAQFPGTRNWGYDGVYPYAVQQSYGGPRRLKELVNACHVNGLAVILDVVHNHLGPEGNYLAEFGPYFTDTYHTPWGRAINYDGAESDHVRNYFIQNALHWFRDYHLDALRLDAVHAIYDQSAHPFLQELAEEVEVFNSVTGHRHLLIAESDLNDARIISPRELGGFGLDAQWADDLHHNLHALLTGERNGYYADFGSLEQFAKCLREGYTYSGQYSAYRRRRHGNSPADRPAKQFIVCTQNHDQVGNRMHGERLSSLVSFEALKLAAAAVLLSPYVPLLFMGEEYAETAPFLYFVSHGDPGLVEAVRQGRKKEFRAFHPDAEPADPQSTETFARSRLQWELRDSSTHRIMLDYYKVLFQLRTQTPALAHLDKATLEVNCLAPQRIILLHRWHKDSHAVVLLSFNTSDVTLPAPFSDGGRPSSIPPMRAGQVPALSCRRPLPRLT